MRKFEKCCDRCGVAAEETPEGMLAYNGPRLVCADCNGDLDDEWHADNPGSVHPIDALNPTAHAIASFR